MLLATAFTAAECAEFAPKWNVLLGSADHALPALYACTDDNCNTLGAVFMQDASSSGSEASHPCGESSPKGDGLNERELHAAIVVACVGCAVALVAIWLYARSASQRAGRGSAGGSFSGAFLLTAKFWWVGLLFKIFNKKLGVFL